MQDQKTKNEGSRRKDKKEDVFGNEYLTENRENTTESLWQFS